MSFVYVFFYMTRVEQCPFFIAVFYKRFFLTSVFRTMIKKLKKKIIVKFHVKKLLFVISIS